MPSLDGSRRKREYPFMIRILRAVLCVCVLAAMPWTPTAAGAQDKSLKVTRIEVNTAGHRKTTVQSGATVKSCSSDPVFSVSFFYHWSGMSIPGTELLRLDAPGHPDMTSASKLFEPHGNSADLATAEEFQPGSLALPGGSYRFKVKINGVTRKAAVVLKPVVC